MNKAKTNRFQLLLDDEQLEKVDSFRFDNRISSRNEAIRLLIEAGLKALAKKSGK